ncbi:GD16437 [Drosophila simulans]|uniref:GD16437 n=1 Tax=Drosophila simulans TaxID=7240 RepID=B4R2M2_DROSI|nr:GD16437 [Drosophila simulans]
MDTMDTVDTLDTTDEMEPTNLMSVGYFRLAIIIIISMALWWEIETGTPQQQHRGPQQQHQTASFAPKFLSLRGTWHLSANFNCIASPSPPPPPTSSPSANSNSNSNSNLHHPALLNWMFVVQRAERQVTNAFPTTVRYISKLTLGNKRQT